MKLAKGIVPELLGGVMFGYQAQKSTYTVLVGVRPDEVAPSLLSLDTGTSGPVRTIGSFASVEDAAAFIRFMNGLVDDLSDAIKAQKTPPPHRPPEATP